MKTARRNFGYLPDGREVVLFRLTNKSGAFVEFTNFGATWVSASVPDSKGQFDDVVLGYPTLEGYLSDTHYLGSTIGRFSNRIGSARFSIGEKEYELEANDGRNSNHGGYSGFNKKLWNFTLFDSGVCFSLFSPDGEGGYPGNLSTEVCYHFSEDNQVTINYKGESDKRTYLNLTNHAYFNLSGEKSILNHFLQVPSNTILETTKDYIPSGQYRDVHDSPFDFTAPAKLGERIFEKEDQLEWNRGYNHCYVLNQNEKKGLTLGAILSDPISGRKLEAQTTLPSVLVYTGNYLETNIPGKKGANYGPYEGICLEAQFFPDTPNHSQFPSCLISKGDIYQQVIVFKFKS